MNYHRNWDDLKRLYETAGLTLTQIGAIKHCSRQAVQLQMIKQGISRRPTGRRKLGGNNGSN